MSWIILVARLPDAIALPAQGVRFLVRVGLRIGYQQPPSLPSLLSLMTLTCVHCLSLSNLQGIFMQYYVNFELATLLFLPNGQRNSNQVRSPQPLFK